jgi:hypothetical protein
MRERGETYVSLAAALGARHSYQLLAPLHYSSRRFPAQLIENYPDLARFDRNSYEDTAPGFDGPQGRLLDEVLRETTGWSLHHVQESFSTRLRPRLFDIVFGHNLTLLHGGWNGGANRVLEPAYFSITEASGLPYEHWLSLAWRRPASWLPSIAT